MTDKELIACALSAAGTAYAPYSHFRVGAALLCASGRVYTGCNIENSSYPVTVCAERTALFDAVKNGERDFIKIAVVSPDAARVCPPCGMCRQALAEFCKGDFEILLCEGEKVGRYTLEQLLPLTFKLEK